MHHSFFVPCIGNFNDSGARVISRASFCFSPISLKLHVCFLEFLVTSFCFLRNLIVLGLFSSDVVFNCLLLFFFSGWGWKTHEFNLVWHWYWLRFKHWLWHWLWQLLRPFLFHVDIISEGLESGDLHVRMGYLHFLYLLVKCIVHLHEGVAHFPFHKV